MTTATKLELRINLGPGIVGQVPELANGKDKNYPNGRRKQARAPTTDSKPASHSRSLDMPAKDDGQQELEEKQEKKAERKRTRRSKHAKTGEKNIPKTILRNKDTPPSRARVVIKEDPDMKPEGKLPKPPSRNTPAVTINSPLRGDPDSPLKPYKVAANRTTLRNSLMRLTTPSTASHSVRSDEKKAIDVQAGMKALRELFSAIGAGTRMLEFKEMLEVKVAIGMAGHVPRLILEEFNNFEKVIEELSVLWKINRMDLDLLEYLLQKISVLERFENDLEKYKNAVGYNNLTASSEREVTTIIASLHNLLQGSEEASGNYTTMCFLHYGDVYSFNRAKLSCMKSDLASLLSIHPTQITYLAKVAANGKGYVTVFEMPCSVSKKLVIFARKNHDILMSLGLKGIQVTGSDGLRYTQSMSYLQDKVSISTQTYADESRIASRNAKTAPIMSSLPPLGQMQWSTSLVRPSVRAHTIGTVGKSQTPVSPYVNSGDPSQRVRTASLQTPHTQLPYVNWGEGMPTPSPYKVDPSLVPQVHPNDAKFERRVNLLKSTLNSMSKPESEELVGVLLEQIRSLHRNIATLKKDLKEKSRELMSSQGFVHRAEKEIKTMEMRLETRAHQISETNDQLLKRVKRLVNENVRLKDLLRNLDAEMDIHRQLEKENRFGNSIRAVRLNRVVQQGVL